MSIVYITDQGTILSKKNERLYLKKDDHIIRWFHTKDIEQLILMGNIALNSQVVSYLLKNKIDTVFMTYFGQYKGRLISEMGKNVQLRIDQINAFQNPDIQIYLAKKYIQSKILNSISLLRRYQYRYDHEKIAEVIIKLNAHLNSSITQCKTLDELRGYEGITAKEYFSVFPLLLRNPDFSFNGRSRRPPLDEPNALLSLCYTFLMNQVLSKAYTSGLDPYVGVLHQTDYGRVSLVFDLMESFRPLCDYLVIKMINRREMRKEHFVYHSISDQENHNSDKQFLPVSLNSDGMKKIVFAFNSLLKKTYFDNRRNKNFTLSNIMQEELYQLIRYIQDKEDFTGFQWDMDKEF